LGIRGSPTAELVFEDVQVPVANRLGEEGAGFKIALAVLDRSRRGSELRPSASPRERSITRSTTSKSDTSRAAISSFQGFNSCWPNRHADRAARHLVYRAATKVDSKALT